MRMRLEVFAFFIASLVLVSLVASPALAGRRVALVIGNSEYEHISRLENPINDAKDVAETLGKLDFEIILVPNADRDRFEQALVEFGSKASGSDLALVYYAGHGVQHGDTNYLLPTDIAGDQGVVEIKAIDMGKVRRQLDKATGVKILILDACRNDPFTRDRGFERASIGSEGAAKGMLIAYAAAPGQVAMDGKGRRNSPFAEVLVDHLKKASGVEIRTLFNQVSDEVSVKTNGKQLPNINSMIHGNFYFLSPDEMCERSWKKAVDSQEPADFKAIVTNYPTCRRASSAQNRLYLFDYYQVCDEEKKKLDAIGANDLDSLSNAAERMKCEAVRAEAKQLAGAARARLRADDVARAEAEAKRVCEVDRKKAQDAVSAYDLDGLDALAKSTKCDAVRKLAETDIAQLQRRCDEERDRLNAVPENDLDRLRADAANIVCKAIRTEAATRIAKLERVCAADRKALDAVQSDDLDELKAKAANIACKSIQQEAAERVARLTQTCEAEDKALRAVPSGDRDGLLAAANQKNCRQTRDKAARLIAALPPEEKTPPACDEQRKTLSGNLKDVATLRAILATTPTSCPDVQADIANVISALEKACDTEVEKINKMSELPHLRAAANNPKSCSIAHDTAHAKIVELEKICEEQREKVAAIDVTGFDAQKLLRALGAEALACAEARDALADTSKAVEKRVRNAQKELKRHGCYKGAINGQLDDATRSAVSAYSSKIEHDEPAGLTDDFVKDLAGHHKPVCAPMEVSRVEPEPPKYKGPLKKKKPRERPESTPRPHHPGPHRPDPWSYAKIPKPDLPPVRPDPKPTWGTGGHF